MELTEHQITLLRTIYNAKNHSVSEDDLPQLIINFPNLDEDFRYFIDIDLIEYEAPKRTYYLAYEGFELLENNIRLVRPKTDYEEYKEIVTSLGGAKKLQRNMLFVVVLFAICMTILLYFNPEITDSNSQYQFNIDESALEKIEIQIQQAIDSIQNANSLKNNE